MHERACTRFLRGMCGSFMGVLLVVISSFLVERQRCGTAERGLPERSERRTLPAVATTVLFALVFIVALVRKLQDVLPQRCKVTR